jgi:hypothetical protein
VDVIRKPAVAAHARYHGKPRFPKTGLSPLRARELIRNSGRIFILPDRN